MNINRVMICMVNTPLSGQKLQMCLPLKWQTLYKNQTDLEFNVQKINEVMFLFSQQQFPWFFSPILTSIIALQAICHSIVLALCVKKHLRDIIKVLASEQVKQD